MMEMQHDALPISSKAVLMPELVVLFLEYAWDQDPHSCDFLDYSLVCSTWRHVAQRILFTRVIIRSYDEASRFLQVVQNNSTLARTTKALNLWRFVVDDDYRIAGDVTSACPQLYELVIQISTDLEDHKLIKLLNAHTYATLQALTLTVCTSEPDQLTMYGILSFLSKFSRLSHLAIPAIPRLKSHDPTEQLPPTPSFKLYELTLPKSHHTDSQIFHLTTQWLLEATDAESLRILDLGTFLNTIDLNTNDRELRDAWLSFLQGRGSGLHSLRLQTEPETILRATRPLSITCPNLRELILNCTLSRTVRQVLPMTYLEHLGFREG